MGQLHQTYGAVIPFFVDDFFAIDLSGDAFDPITTLHDAEFVHPTEMTEYHAEAQYAKNGFLVRPNADGDLYVITRRQWENSRRASLATLEPKKFNGKGGAWLECPVVKVMGGDGDGTGHYVSEATECEIGIIK